MLLAGTDPVILDYYACKNVLYAVSGYGRHDPDTPFDDTGNPYHDGSTSYGYPYNALRLMLESNAAALQAGGHDVTLDAVADDRPRPRHVRPAGRRTLRYRGGATAQEWYFAEGTTRENFDAWACLENPGAAAGKAKLAFQTAGGEEVPYQVDLPARSRVTLHLNHVLGPGVDFSFSVKADVPIVAERPMYFLYNGAWSGGHDVMGAAAPLTEWYFAEGCTRPGFDTWLCLQNPGATPASVDIDYYCGDGSTVTRTGIAVPARSRLTVPVHDPTLGSRPPRLGRRRRLHPPPRRPTASPSWPSAPCTSYTTGPGREGTTSWAPPRPSPSGTSRKATPAPGFDKWLCLQNPGADSGQRGHRLLLRRRLHRHPCRHRRARPLPLHRQRQRRSVGPGSDVSIHVQSTNGVPIVAERPMYFNYNGAWTGGHDVMGAAAPLDEWYFAEGYTGSGFDNWLCLQNPGATQASVDIDYYCGDGSTVTRTGIAVPARSRLTVNVNQELGPGMRRLGQRAVDQRRPHRGRAPHVLLPLTLHKVPPSTRCLSPTSTPSTCPKRSGPAGPPRQRCLFSLRDQRHDVLPRLQGLGQRRVVVLHAGVHAGPRQGADPLRRCHDLVVLRDRPCG